MTGGSGGGSPGTETCGAAGGAEGRDAVCRTAAQQRQEGEEEEDPSISLLLPRRSYEERILVAKAASTAEEEHHHRHFDVRLESYASLTTRRSGGGAAIPPDNSDDDFEDDSDGGDRGPKSAMTKLSSAMATSGPFSEDIFRDALAPHRAVRVRIQIQSISTTSTSMTSASTAMRERGGGGNLTTAGSSRLLPSGPSGVHVSAEFLSPRVGLGGGGEGDDLEKQEAASVRRAFRAILRELAGRHRVVAAPLASVDNRRTRRHVRVDKWVYGRRRNEDEGGDGDADAVEVDVWGVSTILPMQSSPYSAEGLDMFLRRARVPCQGGIGESETSPASAGIFGAADSTSWSNLLMGVAGSVGGSSNEATASSNRRPRGFWFDFRASPECYGGGNRSGRRGSGEDGARCRWEAGQGLFYSVASTSPSPKHGADAAQQRGAGADGDDGNDARVMSLRDFLPPPPPQSDRDDKNGLFNRCTFADSTTASFLLESDGDSNESDKSEPSPKGRILKGCGGTDSDEVLDVPADRESGFDWYTTTIRNGQNLSEPCFSFTTSLQTAGELPPAAPHLPATWEVHLDVLRRSGQANRGSIISMLRNHHPSCSARVAFDQILPPVLEPVWRSLSLTATTWSPTSSSSASTADTPRGNESRSAVAWRELDSREIRFEDDGSMRITFEYSLPASTSLELSLDYEPAFLPFESFPADPNRGFEIEPFRARFQQSECHASYQDQLHHGSSSSTLLYSNPVLLMAPVPDMSMPFNVLSLTCTIYAFVAGAMINLLVRRASERVKYALDPKSQPESKLKRIKNRIKAKFARLIGKKKEEEGEDRSASSANEATQKHLSDGAGASGTTKSK